MIKKFSLNEILKMVEESRKNSLYLSEYYDQSRGINILYANIKHTLRKELIKELEINNKQWSILQADTFAYCGLCNSKMNFDKNKDYVFCSGCGAKYIIDREFEFLYMDEIGVS